MWLDATDLLKLNNNPRIVEGLGTFVRNSFELVLANNPSTQIRTLDRFTVDLPIPSYNNIIAKLNVRELLAVYGEMSLLVMVKQVG